MYSEALFASRRLKRKIGEIIYTTAYEQIEKLKSQKLIIEDEKFAIYTLNLYGYSILIKSIYFSTLVNFIDQFKTPQKNEMVDKMYNLKTLHLSYDSARKLMMDTLFICTEYRNLAAHGGRTYNYICDSSLRTTDIFDQNISVDVIKYKMS